MTLQSILRGAATALALCGAAQAADLSAFIGRWQVDPSLTHMGRNGPNAKNILRSNSFTFIFRNDAEGTHMDVYADYPQAEASRTFIVVPDGSVHQCAAKTSCLTAGGNPKEQTFAYQLLDPHLMTRMLWIKGAAYDYSTMSVATDGKSLTLISWAPETPQYQNIQVFEKQP